MMECNEKPELSVNSEEEVGESGCFVKGHRRSSSWVTWVRDYIVVLYINKMVLSMLDQ